MNTYIILQGIYNPLVRVISVWLVTLTRQWGGMGEHEEGVGQNILIERPLATYYCNLILRETD